MPTLTLITQTTLLKGLTALLICLLLPEGNLLAQANPKTTLESYRQLREQFTQQLTELQSIGELTSDSPLEKQAHKKREALVLRSNGVPLLPEELPQQSEELNPRLKQLNSFAKEYASGIYLLGQQLEQSHPQLAYQFYQEALRVEPHHALSREKLGYVLSQGRWTTPYQQRLESLDYIDHPQFGWLKKNEVPRYEKGDRKYKGRWIEAEREAELRRSFRNAWTIRTEHFLIKTNHSLEAGVELGRQLETFHTYFREIFLPLYQTPAQLQRMFQANQRVSVSTKNLHQVHYFRSRDEYLKTLKDRVPNIEVTNALYWNDDQTAYSYYDPERPNFASLFHEATHQLLYESTSKHRIIAAESNFWVIEGIACYMETFRREGDLLTAGNPNDARVQQTLGQLLQDGWHIPIEQFVQFGRVDFQTAPLKELQRRYGEAATLSYFFMDAQNGRYRQALIEHIADLYSINQQRRQKALSLDLLTGQSFEQLDQEYRTFLTATREAVATPVQP